MGKGFDALIFSFSTQEEADFWKKRLKKNSTAIFTIHEDWPGGAGNGLGTLYAFQDAQKQGLKFDENQSIALFHAAGYGKRLAPLSLAEGGNKSAVVLPGEINGEPLTLLESVIKQTAPLAERAKGRLSVFWSDQLFIPSTPLHKPEYEIELLVKGIPTPTKEEWGQKKLSNYGINNLSDSLHCLGKLDWDTFSKLSQNKPSALNLGVFSLSKGILEQFLKEFSKELTARKGKLDTDPHFWMPATLSETLYNDLMQKNESLHFARMKRFYQSFQEQETNLPLIGATDIGKKSFWWDFGSLSAYYNNSLKVTENSEEGKALRELLNCTSPDERENCLIRSNCDTTQLKNSVLIDVSAKNMEGEELLISNCNSPKISGEHALLYGYNASIQLQKDQVTAQKKLATPLHTTLSRNGKEDWNKKLAKNQLSYSVVCGTLHHKSREITQS